MKYQLFVLSVLSVASVFAQSNDVRRVTFPSWSRSVQAGSVYSLDSDLSGGGSYSVNRYYAEGGLTRMWDFNKMISFSVGYGQEDYRFRGLPIEPWNNIDSYRAGVFARWALNEDWTLFVSPSLKSYVETGAKLDDGLTGSFFGGAGYRFSDSLFLGPAIGVFGRVEDDPMVIPILLVNWDITDRLNFGTGGGFAATAGPGLGFTYEVTKQFKVALLGRYESFRFRLSPGNTVENGVGEDESVSVVGTLTYELYRGTYISGLIGSKFGGDITVNGATGQEIAAKEYDSAAVFGLLVGFSL